MKHRPLILLRTRDCAVTKRRDVEGEPAYLEIMTMELEYINIFVAREHDKESPSYHKEYDTDLSMDTHELDLWMALLRVASEYFKDPVSREEAVSHVPSLTLRVPTRHDQMLEDQGVSTKAALSETAIIADAQAPPGLMVMDRLLSTTNLIRLNEQRKVEFIDTAQGALAPGAEGKLGKGPLDADFVLKAGRDAPDFKTSVTRTAVAAGHYTVGRVTREAHEIKEDIVDVWTQAKAGEWCATTPTTTTTTNRLSTIRRRSDLP